MLLRTPSRIAQGFKNIVTFEVGIVDEQFFHRASRTDLSDNHSDRDAQPADARLATHYGRPDRSEPARAHEF
jgi:hypothetical protein